MSDNKSAHLVQGFHSIANKTLLLVTVTLLVSWTIVLGISYLRFKSILDSKQNEVFNEKLDFIVSVIERNYRELENTGMAEAYREESQQEVRQFLSQKYYGDDPTGRPNTYPFIIDLKGMVVMHPALSYGDSSVQDQDFIQAILAAGNGELDYIYLGKKKWMAFRTFAPWNWTVGYTVPLETKYAALFSLFSILVPIMVLMMMVVIGTTRFVLLRVVTRPVNHTVDMVKGVADGDLTHSLPTEGRDEVSQLAAHFNTMVDNLISIVGRITDIAQKLTDHGSEIRQISQNQAEGAVTQSTAVSQTTAAAVQLSQTSEQIGERIQTISHKAGHVLDGMTDIKKFMDQTSQILKSLSEKSRQIGRITELIDDVADQTNLLAVNASIEAARAGEQGRGFTVVADQISKLADSTGKSTKDITSLVELIQHEMSNATLAMEQSLGSVEEEINLAQDSAMTSKEIAMNANQQISGARQIADAMHSINDTMQGITSGAEYAMHAAEELATLAEELRLSVGQFKIPENPSAACGHSQILETTENAECVEMRI